MKKTMTRNIVIMAIVTVIMAVVLSLYIKNTGTVPAADNAANLTDGTYTSSAHQIGGEDVLQRRLDVLHETGLDGAFFEGVAAMQHEGGVLHGDHVYLVEPCADGGLAELLL